jgi:hypothetical protein
VLVGHYWPTLSMLRLKLLLVLVSAVANVGRAELETMFTK